MRYLVQELGPEGFRDELAKRTGFELTPAGEDLTKHYVGISRRPSAQGGRALLRRLNVPVGRMSGEDFIEAGRLAGEYGGEIRLATDQNFIITGVAEERLEELLAEPLLERFSPEPGAFERGVVACTGSEFCRFGIVRPRSGRSSGPRRWTSASATSARRP
jgi:ferredoxin-nitrite reductase